jgi:hypothetical protein
MAGAAMLAVEAPLCGLASACSQLGATGLKGLFAAIAIKTRNFLIFASLVREVDVIDMASPQLSG